MPAEEKYTKPTPPPPSRLAGWRTALVWLAAELARAGVSVDQLVEDVRAGAARADEWRGRSGR